VSTTRRRERSTSSAATTAAATAAAEAATTAAAAEAAAGAVLLRARLIDRQLTAAELDAIDLLGRNLGLIGRAHGDERETAGRPVILSMAT
jgi:hypothetical protein